MNRDRPEHYMQSTFDKAFVAVINHLVKNKRQFAKFSTQKELATTYLGLRQSTFALIAKGARGVPKQRIDEISQILIKEFGVSDQFLKTGRGEIMNQQGSTSYVLQEPPANYYTQRSNDNILSLREQLRFKDQLLEEKERMIDLLKSTIEDYKRLLN